MTAASSFLSQAALRRVKKPRMRGAFKPIDAARRQLGLLSVADATGQARLHWLIDLATQRIEDARFLAFGDLTSHAVADAFSELARGNTVGAACALTAEQVESLLRDDPVTPAFGDAGLEPLGFLRDLQDRAERALPALRLLPKPNETPIYERKRKQDWDAHDLAWLPLPLLQKAAKVEAMVAEMLRQRVEHPGLAYTITAINDDFRVLIAFTGTPAEQIPTLARFLEDALRSRLHPHLTVEAT